MNARFSMVLDCRDPAELARFWASALGYVVVGGAGSYVLLQPEKDQPGPQLLLQQVPEPKHGKNRMHIDIEVHNVESEAKRLTSLGATRADPEPLHEHGRHWIRLHDPEGNELCACDNGAGTRGNRA